jgi:hypothetical protein
VGGLAAAARSVRHGCYVQGSSLVVGRRRRRILFVARHLPSLTRCWVHYVYDCLLIGHKAQQISHGFKKISVKQTHVRIRESEVLVVGRKRRNHAGNLATVSGGLLPRLAPCPPSRPGEAASGVTARAQDDAHKQAMQAPNLLIPEAFPRRVWSALGTSARVACRPPAGPLAESARRTRTSKRRIGQSARGLAAEHQSRAAGEVCTCYVGFPKTKWEIQT